MARPQEGTATPTPPKGPGNEPPGRPEISRGILLAMWVVLCDVLLKLLAHSSACHDEPRLTLGVFDYLWTAPEGCERFEVVGPFITLIPVARVGAPFGLLEQELAGFAGQAWGLGLLAVATILTILVLRWRWRDLGDPLALGAIWGGALVHGVPRASGPGHTFTELNVLDYGIGVGDVALALGLFWLAWRLLAELRAG